MKEFKWYVTAFLISLLLTSIVCHAKEDWFCITQSSQVEGNQIHACGTGYGKSEPEARIEALKFANYEFYTLCKLQADCMGHKYAINPGRTTCEPSVRYNGYMECTRLVTYTILPQAGPMMQVHWPKAR